MWGGVYGAVALAAAVARGPVGVIEALATIAAGALAGAVASMLWRARR